MRARCLLLPCVVVAVHAIPALASADDGPGTGGRLTIDAPRGAEITIDGKPAGTAPLPNPVDIGVGPHDVQAVVQGKGQTLHLTVAAGTTTAARFEVAAPAPGPRDAAQPAMTSPVEPSESAPAHRSSSTAKYVTVASLGGLAAIGAGLATGFGVGSNQHASNARNLRSQQGSLDYCTLNQNDGSCAQLSTESSAQHTDHIVSEALWISSGALAVAAVATWFLWSNKSSERQPALRLAPSFSARGLGLFVSGSL